MTSALNDAKSIMQALVRGASDGYLTKPLDFIKLRKILEELGISPLPS
jgi:response regulator of citrate/malate metabolism